MSNKTPKVKVLYQNLGGVWYAFTALNENDVFFGQVPLQSSTKQLSNEKNKTKGNNRKPAKNADV